MSVDRALNAVCFTQPHWRVQAQGLDPHSYFEQGEGKGTGGIARPEPVMLNIDHYYYRFSDSTKGEAVALGGAWWISFDTYNTIKHFGEMHGYAVGYAARLFLALPVDWTRVDRIVRARLSAPLGAYAGEGKPALSLSGSYTPLQHVKVTQLYIPGLFLTFGDTQPLYRRVWEDVSATFSATMKSVR